MKSDAWPELDLDEWQDTYATLHMWLQVVGKTRLALTPHVNHWWESPLYLTARGLTTSPIPWREDAFQVDLDFLDHRLDIHTSWGETSAIALQSRPVAEFYALFLESLRQLGIEVSIWPMPVEVPNPIPLDEDRLHATYDPEHARRFWRALLTADSLLKEFRARFVGKDSPVHFFWGSCDLAATRFSGRRAPAREGADFVTKEAYSHEVFSVGWWPGGGDVRGAAFYAYAAPEPPGFAGSHPPSGRYDEKLKEFLLMYDDARRSRDPKKSVLDFFQSAYDAEAELAHWDRAALDRPQPWPTA